jgi:hypothetical protein
VSVLAAPQIGAAQGADSDQWKWSITPYIWLPTINGKFRFALPPGDEGGGTSVDSEIGPSDYLTDLNGVLMLSAELRSGKWAFGGDLIYLDLTADTSTVHTVTGDGGSLVIPRETNLNTETDLSGSVVSLVAKYALSESDTWDIAALGGLRYFTLDVDLNWDLTTTLTGPGFTFARSGNISGDIDMLDAVVGLRGKWWLDSAHHWYVPWYVDVGAGSSDLTWQAMLGGGYAWQRTDVLLAWRQLDYDRDSNDLLQEIEFGGFGVGFSWRF